jgi:hypothetical protein
LIENLFAPNPLSPTVADKRALGLAHNAPTLTAKCTALTGEFLAGDEIYPDMIPSLVHTLTAMVEHEC